MALLHPRRPPRIHHPGSIRRNNTRLQGTLSPPEVALHVLTALSLLTMIGRWRAPSVWRQSIRLLAVANGSEHGFENLLSQLQGLFARPGRIGLTIISDQLPDRLCALICQLNSQASLLAWKRPREGGDAITRSALPAESPPPEGLVWPTWRRGAPRRRAVSALTEMTSTASPIYACSCSRLTPRPSACWPRSVIDGPADGRFRRLSGPSGRPNGRRQDRSDLRAAARRP
jgi:hypothetical protein